MISRRKFVQLSTFAGASFLIPSFAKVSAAPSHQKKSVIVLEFLGGLDGLNTIVPVTNPAYYAARSKLALHADQTLPLSADFGMHPSLRFLHQLFLEKKVAVYQSVTPAGSDRSHHESRAALFDAINGSILPLSARLSRECTSVQTDLDLQFSTVAQCIRNGKAGVFHVLHNGYDTHVNQMARQASLFIEMDDALEKFVSEMKADNHEHDYLVIMVSSFGRRVYENTFEGTDHGTCYPVIVVASQLPEPGLVGKSADLSDLEEGDLKNGQPFERTFNHVVDMWLKQSAVQA